MTNPLIADRTEAGRKLAQSLKHYEHRDDVIVLGLPRGGVPVAYEVAKALSAPLDVILVRKLGVPGHEEFAMGAIATGGICLLMHETIQSHNIEEEAIAKVLASEEEELKRRERTYRQSRPWPDLKDKCVILIDDGLATGATMRAAIASVRDQNAKKIIVAVPVAPAETADALSHAVDEAVFLSVPTPFLAVGRWYQKFGQTSDGEVLTLLEKAWEDNTVES